MLAYRKGFKVCSLQCNHCAAFLNFVVFGGDFRIVNQNLQEVCIFSVGLELQTICRALRPYAVCAFNDGRQSRDSARTKLPSCKVGDFLSAVFILIELTTSAFVVILYAVCFGRCRSTLLKFSLMSMCKLCFCYITANYTMLICFLCCCFNIPSMSFACVFLAAYHANMIMLICICVFFLIIC